MNIKVWVLVVVIVSAIILGIITDRMLNMNYKNSNKSNGKEDDTDILSDGGSGTTNPNDIIDSQGLKQERKYRLLSHMTISPLTFTGTPEFLNSVIRQAKKDGVIKRNSFVRIKKGLPNRPADLVSYKSWKDMDNDSGYNAKVQHEVSIGGDITVKGSCGFVKRWAKKHGW